MPSTGGGGSGGAGRIEVARTTLSGDGTSIILSGLDGDAHRFYKIEGYVWLTAATRAGTCQLDWRPNGLTSNLNEQRIDNYGGAPSTDTAWNMFDTALSTTLNNVRIWVSATMMAATSLNGTSTVPQIRCEMDISYNGNSTLLYEIVGTWHQTSTNLTSLELVSSTADILASGSELVCYRDVVAPMAA